MSFFANAWKRLLSWLQSLFWKQQLEFTIVGLQHAGKTTLLNVIADENFKRDEQYLNTIPTQGLNTRKVSRGNVQIKIWDIGGQQRFRQMWWRYCRRVDCIVFVVDAADASSLDEAKQELHDLLRHSDVQQSIPVLVLGNKNDLENALREDDLVNALGLREVKGREIACYSISCKNVVNIDKTLEWLIKHSRKSS